MMEHNYFETLSYCTPENFKLYIPKCLSNPENHQELLNSNSITKIGIIRGIGIINLIYILLREGNLIEIN
jgi:hypothetical protein